MESSYIFLIKTFNNKINAIKLYDLLSQKCFCGHVKIRDYYYDFLSFNEELKKFDINDKIIYFHIDELQFQELLYSEYKEIKKQGIIALLTKHEAEEYAI